MRVVPRVVVLGGGFAGLETAFYLRYKLEERVVITLVSDRDYFLFKPNMIYIPFGKEPEQFKVYLDEPCRRKKIDLIQGTVRALDTEHHTVRAGDRQLAYDYVVIATGAALQPKEIPGLEENSVTIWTPEEMLRLRAGLQTLRERATGGTRQRLLFVIPPGNLCPSPLYEVALMTDTWLREQGARASVEVTFVTFESSYIQAYGPRLNTVVGEEFDERGIWGHRNLPLSQVEPGTAVFAGGDRLPYDLLVTFPPFGAAKGYAQLPVDERGFVAVEPDSRRVKGSDRIFAAGDAANFPLKQAFLALLQADAAAEHIAAAVDHRTPDVNFEPMSIYVMDELNKGAFAQIPMKYTGDEAKPVRVAVEDHEHYKVGVSPLWRAGKRFVGEYLPWRFGHGEPFNAGFAYEAMDKGLKVMSNLLAR